MDSRLRGNDAAGSRRSLQFRFFHTLLRGNDGRGPFAPPFTPQVKGQNWQHAGEGPPEGLGHGLAIICPRRGGRADGEAIGRLRITQSFRKVYRKGYLFRSKKGIIFYRSVCAPPKRSSAVNRSD